jgi:hypothetical protein
MGITTLLVAIGFAVTTGPAPARTVPCSESIDGTKFPYVGYRLVLDAVSAPPAFLKQVVPTGERPWGSACVPLIFRVGGRSATVRFGLGRRCG